MSSGQLRPKAVRKNLGEILLDSAESGQAECLHGIPVVRHDRHCGALFRRQPAKRRSRDGERAPRRHLGKAESDRCQVRAVEARVVRNSGPTIALFETMANDLRRSPIYLWEARNAVQIARWTGADKYAGDSFTKAEGSPEAGGRLQGSQAGQAGFDDRTRSHPDRGRFPFDRAGTAGAGTARK